MANNESSCTAMGCTSIFVIGIMYTLFTAYPILMTILCSMIVVAAIIGYLTYRSNKKEEEAKRLRALNLYSKYPLFFKAFYFQNVSKKKFEYKDISDNLKDLNSKLESITDYQAEKWNNDIELLEDLDKVDHKYFITIVQGLNVLSEKKLKRLTVNPAFVLPFEIAEKLASKSVDQWIAEKKQKEQFEEYKSKYSEFLPNFLHDNPEIKTERQIMGSENLLRDYISKHKKKLEYTKWKRNQSAFNTLTETLVPSYFVGGHVIKRQINIKGINDSENSSDDAIVVNQIALREYSDYATSEQSEADLECHDWVKSLSFCKANFSKDTIERLSNYIKACSNNFKEKSLVVLIKNNFLSWDGQTTSYHYQQFADKLLNIEHCDVENFREKIENNSLHYQFVFILDLISDENQVYDVCEKVISPYVHSLPNILYISLVRELTEQEIQVRIENEKQHRLRLLRYDTIVEDMPNGLTVWSAIHPNADKEETVNSEKDIQNTELQISTDTPNAYKDYFEALGMKAGLCIQRNFKGVAIGDLMFVPFKIGKSIQSIDLSNQSMLGIELGEEATFRTICVSGLNSKIKDEINEAKEVPFPTTTNIDSLLHKILNILGLPFSYPWIIINGIGTCLYILVKSGIPNDKSILSSVNYANSKFIEQHQNLFYNEEKVADFQSIRINWNGSQIMPPSTMSDINQSKYYFLNMGMPDNQPQNVSITQIDELLYAFCSRIEYKTYTHNGRNLYVAIPNKIRYVYDINNSSMSESRAWIKKSDSTGANIIKGIDYAIGINGCEQNGAKALYYLERAGDNPIAKYNLASLIAAGLISSNVYKMKYLISVIDKKMKYINVIKNNANFTFNP